jgi:hypothetical protein
MTANILEAFQGVNGLRKAEQITGAMLVANAVKNFTAALCICSIFYGKSARFFIRTLPKFCLTKVSTEQVAVRK